jgi:hypothetical protein
MGESGAQATGRRRAWLVAGGLGPLLILLLHWSPLAFQALAIASLFLLLARWDAWWVCLFQFSIGLALSLFGFGFHYPRLTVMYSWLFALEQIAFCTAFTTRSTLLFSFGTSSLESLPPPIPNDTSSGHRYAFRVIGASYICVAVLVAFVFLPFGAASVQAPVKPLTIEEKEHVESVVRDKLRASSPGVVLSPKLAELFPASTYANNNGALFVERVRVSDPLFRIATSSHGSFWDLPQEPLEGEEVFQKRSYPYSRLALFSPTLGGLWVAFPGTVPAVVLNTDVVLVGVVDVPSHDWAVRCGVTIEGVAVLSQVAPWQMLFMPKASEYPDYFQRVAALSR